MWDMKQEYSDKKPYDEDVEQLAIDFLDTLESSGFSRENLKQCIFSVPAGISAAFNEGLKAKILLAPWMPILKATIQQLAKDRVGSNMLMILNRMGLAFWA